MPRVESCDSCIQIRAATSNDVPVILSFIRGLAKYEKLECVATENSLQETLFGERRYAEVLIGSLDEAPAGFALFFHNYSTFLAKPGIYLEDLFVEPAYRCKGVGRGLLNQLIKIARDRNCGRLEWSVLDWNTPAINFYKRIGASILPQWHICRMTREQIDRLARG